jgi:anti-anti-sigma factor
MDGISLIVQLSGELDIATRGLVEHACLDGSDVVVVEMGGLTFMDCGGYSGLLAARRVLESRGGSLALRSLSGQPARLLESLAVLDAAQGSTVGLPDARGAAASSVSLAE